MHTELPPDDDTTTTTKPPPAPPACPVCWTVFQPVGRQRFCSGNCRKTAWARLQAVPRPTVTVPPAGQRRDSTVYACASCDARYYGQQWCHDCNHPCTRVGLGGLCPHCEAPVALTDLLDTPATPPPNTKNRR